MVDEKLLQKINDLLALSQSQVNEHEASLAMEMAQRLLLKHNLTISQVELLRRNEQAESAVGLDRWIYDEADWKKGLIYAVSRAYLCHAVTAPACIMMIGRPENIAICESVWTWLIPNIELTGKLLSNVKHHRNRPKRTISQTHVLTDVLVVRLR